MARRRELIEPTGSWSSRACRRSAGGGPGPTTGGSLTGCCSGRLRECGGGTCPSGSGRGRRCPGGVGGGLARPAPHPPGHRRHRRPHRLVTVLCGHHVGAGQPLGRRGGYGTKVHLVTDGNGLPLGAAPTPDPTGWPGTRATTLRASAGGCGPRASPRLSLPASGRPGTAPAGAGRRPSTRWPTAGGTSPSGASTGWRSTGGGPPGSRSWPPATWPWFRWR